MPASLILPLGLTLTAAFSAGFAILVLWAIYRPDRTQEPTLFSARDVEPVFIFDGEHLLDASATARAILDSAPEAGSDMNRLLCIISRDFPHVEDALAKLPQQGQIVLSSFGADGFPVVMQAELSGGLTKIRLSGGMDMPDPANNPDPVAHSIMAEELRAIRELISDAPLLAWREREDGEIIWANAPYLLRAADSLPAGQGLSWPLPRLFDRMVSLHSANGQRQKLVLPDGRELWFDVTSKTEPAGRKLFAVPCDSAVQAELTLRDFMQTLSKTFAHLPIGLAVFDSKRHLHLFNPALMDLTGLPPDFLAMRPSILAFLDALREKSMVPEPKDFRSWRRQLVEMERASTTGGYEETWMLPGGQTFRVSARPHPNGALALMFEDISNEMLRSRRYRADLELGQSVIDSMDEAVAVFSDIGHLVMTNSAYGKLWDNAGDTSAVPKQIRDLVADWRKHSAPSAYWAEVEDFVATIGERETWGFDARLLDGRLMTCRLVPLAGGATLAGFKVKQPVVDDVTLVEERPEQARVIA